MNIIYTDKLDSGVRVSTGDTVIIGIKEQETTKGRLLA